MAALDLQTKNEKKISFLDRHAAWLMSKLRRDKGQDDTELEDTSEDSDVNAEPDLVLSQAEQNKLKLQKIQEEREKEEAERMELEKKLDISYLQLLDKLDTFNALKIVLLREGSLLHYGLPKDPVEAEASSDVIDNAPVDKEAALKEDIVFSLVGMKKKIEALFRKEVPQELLNRDLDFVTATFLRKAKEHMAKAEAKKQALWNRNLVKENEDERRKLNDEQRKIFDEEKQKQLDDEKKQINAVIEKDVQFTRVIKDIRGELGIPRND